MYPFVFAQDEILVLGYEDGELLGLSIDGERFYSLDAEDIDIAISVFPAAVYYGVTAVISSSAGARAAANKRRVAPRYKMRGKDFPLLPPGTLSGFPEASRALRKHRRTVPSVDTIFMSLTFALGSVQTPISVAEKSFKCFTDLYLRAGRSLPPVEDFISCFVGLQNSKTEMFKAAWEFAPVVHDYLLNTYAKDGELRRELALETSLPRGLGLSKLSFVLALLGQDCVCIDARLLNVLLPEKKERERWMKRIGKINGRLRPESIDHYEALERAFLTDNPHYKPWDPIGKARAQWQSWEAVGGASATHSVWLDVLDHE